MRIALCQMNATVGDIAGNARRIRAGVEAARAAGAELVAFPELAVTGYPPEDLLLREHFLDDARMALDELAAQTEGIVAVVGFPERAGRTREARPADDDEEEEEEEGEEAEEFLGTPRTPRVHNAAAVLAEGAVRSIYRKVHLPNYGVFDEQRYFEAGRAGAVIEVGGHPIGLTICEDLWRPGRAGGHPISEESAAGARLIVNISASPYHAGKGSERERLFAERAREHGVHIAFCGLVGGQDELVFDGHSFVLDPSGETIARATQFEEQLLVCDLDLDHGAGEAKLAAVGGAAGGAAGGHPNIAHGTRVGVAQPPRARAAIAPVEAEIYCALCLGLRDYVRKNGFAHVVLGLSGGIDSALVGCLAVDALGAERVSAAVMPSPYSSAATQDDARALAAALGVRVHELPIAAAMDAYAATLAETGTDQGDTRCARIPESASAAGACHPASVAELAGREADLTEENLQARIRGNLLMALSNKFGWLVLTTGNKSEMSVGYTTLYGDLAGGFAVIKDVPKTLVYRLCEWRNSLAETGIRAAGACLPASAETGTDQGDTRCARIPESASAEGACHPASVGATCELPIGDFGERVPAPIPPSILDRAPSAELRADQRDEDSLPPYPLLDRILHGYIELDRSREQLIAEGLPEAEVDRTIRLVDRAEYKRRQAPPGIKITTRAFGRDRRMPITNRYGCPPAP